MRSSAMTSQSSAPNNLMRCQSAKYPTAVFLERLAGSPLAHFRSLTGLPGLARVKAHVEQGVRKSAQATGSILPRLVYSIRIQLAGMLQSRNRAKNYPDAHPRGYTVRCNATS